MLDFELYFCNDGILRASLGEKHPLIPLTFLEQNSKTDQLSFWTFWWEKTVYFEAGLTFGNLLNCLEPWQEVFGKISGKDLSGYIAESHLPAENTTLDWISIFKIHELDAEVEYDHIEGETIRELLKRKRKSRLTGKWNLNSKYVVNGYQNNQDEHYSLAGTPMNQLTHTPVYLLDYEHVVFFQSNIERLSDQPLPINTAGFTMQTAKTQHSTIHFIETSAQHNLLDLLRGMFSEFSDTIEIRNEMEEQLKMTYLAYQSGEPLKDKPSSMKEEMEQLNNYWERMLSKADQNVQLKTDKVTIGKAPERRLYGIVIEEQKLDTPFKGDE